MPEPPLPFPRRPDGRSRHRETTPPPSPQRAWTSWLVVVAVAAGAWVAGARMTRQPERTPSGGGFEPAENHAVVPPPVVPPPPIPEAAPPAARAVARALTQEPLPEPEFTPAPRVAQAEVAPDRPAPSEREPKAKPRKRARPAPAQEPVEATVCGKFGTRVDFAPSPVGAVQRALKERKLLLLVHISGNFEDKGFT